MRTDTYNWTIDPVFPKVIHDHQLDTDGMAGTMTLEVVSDWVRNDYAIILTQDRRTEHSGHVVAAQRAVPRNVLVNSRFMGVFIQALIADLRPWRRPDPNPFPPMVLSPLLFRIETRLLLLRWDWDQAVLKALDATGLKPHLVRFLNRAVRRLERTHAD